MAFLLAKQMILDDLPNYFIEAKKQKTVLRKA